MKNKSYLFECRRNACLAALTALSVCLVAVPNARSQAYTFSPAPPEDVTKAAGNEMNPSVTINPLNPNDVFTVAASDLGALVTAVSTNQGSAWVTTNIANGKDNLSQAFQYPSSAFDSYGNLYVAYLPATFEGVSIAVSTNNGQNFTMLTNLAAGDATDTPRICAGPATAPGSVWVVYKDNSQSGTPLIAQGLLATNLATNSQFGPPFIIPGSASGGFPDIAIGPAGQVMVAYQNNLTSSGNSRIFVSVNTNAFSTNGFGAATTVTANAVGGLTYIPAQSTGIGVNASVSLAWDTDPYSSFYGRAYVIYSAITNINKNQLDIGFRYSLNNGSTWSAQETVNDDTNGVESHFMPRVAVDPVTGIVACSWYDCRNDQGSGSQQITESENATFTFSTFFPTNIMIPPNTSTLTTTINTNNTAGTSFTVAIVGTNLMGSLLSTNGTTPYSVTLSTAASNYFFDLQFVGNSGTNATGTNTSVTVLVVDTFSDAFTSGTSPNTEPMMYTTISTTGGTTFQANKSVIITNQFATANNNGITSLISPIPPDSLANPPVEGFGSDVATSQSAFGLGSYTGLAFYAGSFYPAWADNSDIDLGNPDGPLKNFDVTIVQESVPTSDLTLFITNSPSPVLSDGVIAYSVVAINNGPFASTGVTVVDALPANVVFETAVPSVGGSYNLNGNDVTLTFPSIPSHGALTNLVLVRAGFSAYGTNVAVISGPLPDTLPTNNTNILVTLFEGEDLGVGMTTSSLNLYGGQTVTNTISVTNFGPSANGNVIVSNGYSSSWGQLTVLSSGWTQVAAAVIPGEYSINGNVIDMNVGLLASNQTTNIVISALALATAPTGVSTVYVSSLDFDTNLANNSATITGSTMTAETVSAGISVGQAQVGVPLTFTIVVTNHGPSSYGYLAATNTLPSSFTGVQVLQSPLPATVTNSEIIFPIGPVPSNGTVTLVFTAIPQTVAPVTDTFTVSSFDYAPAFTSGTSITSAPPSTPIENFQVIPGSSGAFLVWNTPAEATVQVDYGTNAAYGKVSSLSGPSTHHIVLLSGLTPGMTYYFNALTTEAGTLYPTNGTFSTGPSTLILQTQDATYGGLWTANTTGTGIYGSYFSTSDTVAGNPTATATYAPNIPVSGDYNVSIWYPISTTFATNTPVYISGATNELFVTVNQNINGGNWLPIATNVYFAVGTGGNVVIANNTGYTNKGVAANAVEWTYGTGQDTANGSIPSWWANFYFGTNATVSGSADADGDGYSNYAEYVFGTDPTDPNSKLSFTVTSLGGNTVSVNFSPYQGGRNYQLLSATSLTSTQWTVLTNVVTVDANGNGVFTVTQPNGVNAFYRLSASISQ